MKRLIALLVALAFLVAACGDDGDDAAPSGSEGEVAVVLSEWIVEPDPLSAAAGDVTFAATNEGGEVHELVIVRGDDPEALPVDESGKVQEDELEAGAFIGEIEEFDSGTTESATFELDAGSYLLFCNIVEEESDGTFESHFLEGMVSPFTVS